MKEITLLKIISKYVDRNVLSLSYKMHVLPHLDYVDRNVLSLSYKMHVLPHLDYGDRNVLSLSYKMHVLPHLDYVDRNVLSLSYKMHVLQHLDYGDVIYHNSRTDLMDFIERVQYKAALIVSGCWQVTSRTKRYDKLSWESLSDRRWVRRLTLFYKIPKGLAPLHLSPHIPTRNEIRNCLTILVITTRESSLRQGPVMLKQLVTLLHLSVLDLVTFGGFVTVFLTGGNLPYLLFLMALRS